MQITTATRFSAFDEPNPLGDYATMTAPTLGDGVDAVLDRIDNVLEQDAWLDARLMGRGWTHVDDAARIGRLSRALAFRARAAITANPELGATGFVGEKPEHEPSAHLEASLQELQRWLGVGLDVASTMTGISRGTVYAWRERRSTPRPATIGAILRVHALVSAAVKAAGEEPARAWFHSGDPSALSELRDARGNSDAVRHVSSRVRRELMRVSVPPPNPLLAASVDDLDR